MEYFEDSEFSAIYESIEDSDSDGDEYVTVSQPSMEPYLCPEPRYPPPPPPPTAPPPGDVMESPPLSLQQGISGKQAKKPKLRKALPSFPVAAPGNTPHFLSTDARSHLQPLISGPTPLPRVGGGGGGKGAKSHKSSVQYKKLTIEDVDAPDLPQLLVHQNCNLRKCLKDG